MKNPIFRYTALISAIAGLGLGWASDGFGAPVAPKPTRRARIRYKPLPPPPTGNPAATSGAGSRGQSGSCPAVTLPLTALVPTATAGEFVWGRTLEARPTVWVYLPYTLTPALPGELRLREQDAADNTTNTTIVRISNAAPGVVGIRLPAQKTLVPDRLYYWSFVVLCDPNDASANQFVKAAIQRIAPPPALAEPTDSEQKAAFYAEEGIWYDAITQLGRVRRDRPQNASVAETWTDLLKGGGFDRIALQPILLVP